MNLIEKNNQLCNMTISRIEYQEVLSKVLCGKIVDVSHWGRQSGKTTLMLEAARSLGLPLVVYTHNVMRSLRRNNPDLTIIVKNELLSLRGRPGWRQGVLIDAEVDPLDITAEYGMKIYGGLQGFCINKRTIYDEEDMRWTRR